jgi:hypothetical protein
MKLTAHVSTADNDSSTRRLPSRIRRRDNIHEADGAQTLITFEEALNEIGQCLEDLSTFWQARSADFPTSNSQFSSTGVMSGLKTMKSCDFFKIDSATINDHRESISAHFDALKLYVPDVPPSTRRTKGKRQRLLEFLNIKYVISKDKDRDRD